MTSRLSQPKSPMSIFDLTLAVKSQLQRRFNGLWITGEISGLSQASSGHCYLTLKDPRAQLNAIIWRNTAERLKFQVENGQEVNCYGSIDVYPQRGTYQFIIERIEPKGLGSLELAFRQLHAKLEAEGLFAPQRKKPLPLLPRKIAVVTSPTGAAIRDFLQVLERRWSGLDVLVVPAMVQGQGASRQIANGIRLCQKLAERPDVIVVTRGGGSKEDLWSFNEEVVCRAISDSKIPVVSGVGHEIDVTLSDLVADVRALTPSEAAERIVPHKEELLRSLKHSEQRLRQALLAKLKHAYEQLDGIATRPVFARPLEQLRARELEIDQLARRLGQAASQRLSAAENELRQLASKLETLNPTAVLARGFSLTTEPTGAVVRDAQTLSPGDKIQSRLNSGLVISTVDEIIT